MSFTLPVALQTKDNSRAVELLTNFGPVVGEADS